MVFESIVADLLNRFLGDYVENLDRSQLQIGIWGGDVVLHDLILKQSALNELDLPVKTVAGRLGKLTLKIPWKNLYTAPVEACIERLFLLVVPNSEVKYDATKEEKYKQEAKQKELQRIDKAKQAEKGVADKQNDSFAEKLATQVIRNVQIKIQDIHIRYEDRVTCPEQPFALGFTLHLLSVQTTNNNWQPCVVQDSEPKFHKLVELIGFAVYWNCECRSFLSLSDTEKILMFQRGIASSDYLPKEYSYLLGPIDSSAQLTFVQRPELLNFADPKVHLTVKMRELVLGIGKNQYQDLVQLLDAMDRMGAAARYRKYRPNIIGYKGHYKELWRFAYKCILEEDIRRRWNNWDWNHIKSHRNLCHRYAEAYSSFLMSRNAKFKEIMDDCEAVLDVFNITLIRQKTEMEVGRKRLLEEERKATQGWLSSWWGGGRKEAATSNEGAANDVVSRIENAMTPEERAKLFRAIGYGEGIVSPENIPPTYVENSLNFSLSRLVVEVRDGTGIGTIQILNARMSGVKFQIQQRPVSALRVIASVSLLEVSGHPAPGSDGIAPLLVAPTSHCEVDMSSPVSKNPSNELLHILYETEPLDMDFDQRLIVHAAPLHIVYDALTVESVLDAFRPPEGVALERLRAAAISGIEDFKEMSATGMHYAIERHKKLELQVNIMPSRILVPQKGVLTKDCALLIINLGGLVMKSVPQEKRMMSINELVTSGANEKEIFDEMLRYAYDHFSIQLKDMQVLMACGKEDWESVVGGHSDLHILHPTGLEVGIYLCLLTDDPRLPKVKVTARLPPVHVRFSDERLVSLANLLQSIPLPKSEQEEDQAEVNSIASSLQNLAYGEFGPKIDSMPKLQIHAESSSQENLQFTLMQMSFEADEFSVSLRREADPADVSLIEFSVNSFEATVRQRTFDLSASMHIGNVALRHDVTSSKKPVNFLIKMDDLIANESDVDKPVEKNHHLLAIEFFQVSNKSPDFKTEWQSVERAVSIHLAGVILSVHAEAIMELKQFALNLLEKVSGSKSKQLGINEFAMSVPSRAASTLNLNIPNVKKKHRRINPDLVHLKLDVILEQFGISCHVAAHVGSLMRFDAKTLKASVIMKETHTECRASLGSIHTLDLSPKTIHKEVVRPLAGKTLVLEVVMWEKGYGGGKDLRLSVSLGRIQFIFLNRFISTLMSFINNFQETKEAIMQASANAAEAAKQNMKEAYAQAMRIALNIKVEAPIIIIPTDSLTRDAIVLDLGVLSIENAFRTLPVKNDEGNPATLDEIQIDLQNLKLIRVQLPEEGCSNKEESTLIEPISFGLRLQRNLSSGWYRDEPEMEISGRLESILITVCEGDMAVIRRITSDNLSETGVTSGSGEEKQEERSAGEKQGEVVALRPDTLKGIQMAQVAGKLVDAGAIMEEAKETPVPLVSVRLAFVMDNLKIDLLRGQNRQEGVENGLAHIEFGLLSIRGCLFSDSSASLSLRLMHCLMKDSRRERGAITRLLRAGASLQRGSHSVDSSRGVIDLTVRRKDDDLFADVRIFGFETVLCLPYLTEVSTFFAGSGKTSAEVVQPEILKSCDQIPVVEPEPSLGSIHLNLKVERSDIVLIADTEKVNTEALLLQGEIEMKYRAQASHWNVNGSMENIRLLSCQYNPDLGGTCIVEVLRPCRLSLAGSTPEGSGPHVEVSLSDLCLSVFPGTIALLSKVSNSLAVSPDDPNKNGQSKNVDYIDVWRPKKFSVEDYWFLKTEVGEDALLMAGGSTKKSKINACQSEMLLFSAPVVKIAFEAGIGGRALPLLLMQVAIQGKITDWSSRMRLESSMTLKMDYYNGGLAIWEPIVETVECPTETDETKREPWELFLEVESGSDEVAQILSPNSDDMEEIKLPQPNLMASLSSKDNLELTITKTCLDVISILGTAFQSAIDEGTVSSSAPTAPYLVQNDLGVSVNLVMKGTNFMVANAEESGKENIREICLQSGAQVSLGKTPNKNEKDDPFTSSEEVLTVEILTTPGGASSGGGGTGNWRVDLPIARAERRHFTLRRHQGEPWSLISEVTVEDGHKVITLRSAVQVVNELREPAEVYYMTPRGNEVERIGGPLAPKDVLNLPLHAVHTPTAELFFRVEKSTVSIVPFVWKELQRVSTFSSILRCDQKGGSPVYIQAIGETERIPHERTGKHTLTSVCHRVYLRPTVILRNLLPMDIVVTQSGIHGDHNVKAGDDITLLSACPGACSLVIRIPDYLEREWSCLEEIMLNQPELSVWTFTSHDAMKEANLDLGVHGGKSHGTLELSIFSPCWMVNKTGYLLSYKAAEDPSHILYHPADLDCPILFATKGKSFFGKKKASVRIDDSDWSSSFSLDAVGSSGIVICNTPTLVRQLGVHVQLTGCSLTKRVTFMPRVVLMNTAEYDLECREDGRPADPWVKVPSAGCSAFWPVNATGELVVRVSGTKMHTAPFPIDLMNPTLLRLANKYGGVQVETQTTEGATYITFGPYKPGLAPALIINHLRKPMELWEKGNSGAWTVNPGESSLFTWSDPSGARMLCWKDANGKEISDNLREDSLGEVVGGSGFWVSFLDGMQRVLLLTEDVMIAQEARTSGELEAASMDLSFSLHGLGLSLIDDSKGQEVLHAGIVSSGVIWEGQKSGGKRYRALSSKESAAVEKAYQKFQSNQLSQQTEDMGLMQVDSKTMVDFNLMMMERPHKRHLRRSFLTGLWLEMQTSPHGRKIHAKINRLQVDCQLPDSVFPTIFAPVPPPKSVATDSAPKPFVELSIVQRVNEHSPVQQFKYFKILVQEFHVKLDIGFLNALLALFSPDQGLGVLDAVKFKSDMVLIKEPLLAFVTLRSSEELKNFYDHLHFTPLKMHLSFSLSQSGGTSGFQSPFLNILLQSVGVTLTDVQDVVFKLAYFERKGVFLNHRQLIQEVSMHYIGQSLKQLYVLVLGLDVIGNPFGLVLGFTQGVEDLFYEPFQGAVQGPGEFAEGLILGVRSLFGHTVGGAAGAASRIAGTLGKGIAALSFDPEYQRRRREQMGRRPANIQEGLARGGRGLVTGVVDGVSGLVLKPISGAKEEGFGGFLKGMGKGVVGLVARPTAGVVDFAGGSLDAVRRVTECSEQVTRLRLPRFLIQGGPVRQYNSKEADGNRLLKELDRGRFASTDTYVYHTRLSSGVILLTDQRILFLRHNDVFGQWQPDWEHTWSEMGGPPHLAEGGIALVTPRRKVLGLFGGGEQGRLLSIPNARIRTVILGKMEELYNNAK